MANIARNLRKCREDAGLSQQALAERVIVTRQSISNWERGVSQPDLDMLASIASALQVDVTELLYGKRPPDEFLLSRPMRVRTALLLGIPGLILLLLAVFYVPWLREQVKITYRVDPYYLARGLIYPFLFGTLSAAFAAMLAIFSDFRIRSIRLRRWLLWCGGVLFAGMFFIALPARFLPTTFLWDWMPAFCLWIYENPALFGISGILLFCGCNRKPPEPYREGTVNSEEEETT
ncbi:MAG: helix-turn-helix transcriptional regulator [Ruminococcaceae bacterium]|nr:helix-turn-helix transcriptional regulator [Oscillospiraceae bacterium]